jgi:uncharacterized protein YjbI with pentapeptide repeats
MIRIKIEDDKYIEVDALTLEGVCLDGVYAHRAMLEAQNLRKALIRDANFSGAFACRVDLTDADLTGSYLFVADFSDAILHRTTFRNCHLGGAWFDGADLREAVLENADLRSAKFVGTRLQGADLRSNSLALVRSLKGATFDSRTLWPEGFDPLLFGALYAETSISS